MKVEATNFTSLPLSLAVVNQYIIFWFLAYYNHLVFLHFSLQFFHIASHNGGGGESLIVDGIACALKLQQENKQAFDFLANNAVPGVYFVRK